MEPFFFHPSSVEASRRIEFSRHNFNVRIIQQIFTLNRRAMLILRGKKEDRHFSYEKLSSAALDNWIKQIGIDVGGFRIKKWE